MSKATAIESLPPLEKPGINSVSFTCLMLTQWLTSINDNIFRWLVIGIGKDYVNPGDWGNILMVGSAVFLLPYLLLASPAGWLADRFRKVDVIIGCKIAEVVIMCLGVFAIAIGNVPLLFVTVGLMGAQSALFAPSKVATIPDLVHDKELSAANGWFGLSTVTATIIGMGVGNWLADFCGDFGQSNLWASAGILVGIAFIGTLFSLGIQKFKAANPKASFPWNAPVRTVKDLATLFRRRDLFIVSIGETFFWSIGMLATLNIDSFAVESGGLFETSKLPLLISLVFGVGFGSVLAGFWSAGRVELGMLHIGAFFIAFFSIAMMFTPTGFLADGWSWTSGMILSCFFLMSLGAASGLFDVPLAAYLQKKSPVEQRGTILAANNFLIFTGMFVHSILFGMLGAPVREGSIQNIEEIRATSEGLTTDDRLKIEKICSEFDGHLKAASAKQRETGMEPPGFYEILLGAENPKVLAKQNAEKNGGTVEKELLIETYLGDHPELPRGVLYAHLLWTEFSHRKENGELGTLDDYYRRFPEDMALSQAVFRQIGGIKRFNSRQIFVIMGLATIPVFVFVIWRLPLASLRFDAWWILRFFYRIRIHNEKVVPENMGAIVICNHISWLDRTLFLLFSPRRIRLVSFSKPKKGLREKWWQFWGMIRIAGGPSAIQQSLAEARKALAHGELLILFPEEKISTTGALGEFHPSLQLLLDKSPVPIIPAHIDEIWGSLFTYERGRLFWKFPKRIRQPVSLEFGEPLPRPTTVFEARQALQKLGAKK